MYVNPLRGVATMKVHSNGCIAITKLLCKAAHLLLAKSAPQFMKLMQMQMQISSRNAERLIMNSPRFQLLFANILICPILLSPGCEAHTTTNEKGETLIPRPHRWTK